MNKDSAPGATGPTVAIAVSSALVGCVVLVVLSMVVKVSCQRLRGRGGGASSRKVLRKGDAGIAGLSVQPSVQMPVQFPASSPSSPVTALPPTRVVALPSDMLSGKVAEALARPTGSAGSTASSMPTHSRDNSGNVTSALLASAALSGGSGLAVYDVLNVEITDDAIPSGRCVRQFCTCANVYVCCGRACNLSANCESLTRYRPLID